MPDIVQINVTRFGGRGSTYALTAGDDLGLMGMMNLIVGMSGRVHLENSLIKLVEYAKELCPVVTGNLQDSIDYSIEADGKNGAFGSMKYDVPYAVHVNDGWSGHPEGAHFLEGALDMLKSEMF